MRRHLQLAALILLAGAAAARAQITSPDILVGHAPAPPQRRHADAADNLQWLWAYTHEPDSETALALRDSPAFKQMLRSNFVAPQSFWAEGQLPLREAIALFLTRYTHIAATENRYITIDGCVLRFCPTAGLLWVDVGTPHPLTLFAAVNWATQERSVQEPGAPYTMWVFANKPLAEDSVPEAFARAIAAWNHRLAEAGRVVPHITRALLIDPDGTPHNVPPARLGANRTPAQAATNPADGAGTD